MGLRNRLLTIIAFIMVAASFTTVPLTVRAQGGQTYVVQPGETLYRIALRFNVSVDSLAAANGITDPAHIVAGQVLVIPDANGAPASNSAVSVQSTPVSAQPQASNDAPTVPSGSATTTQYTVLYGETLNSIARKFNVTVDLILTTNAIYDANLIFPGQQLTIPGATIPVPVSAPVQVPVVQSAPLPDPSTLSGKTHVVQRGDTLASIAAKYGVSWMALAGVNNINNANLLYVGTVLQIPNPVVAGAEGSAAASLTAPGAPITTGKMILVVLSEQRIYVYQDNQMIRTSLASTGLPGTPTVLGTYNIYVKYPAQLMVGPGYYLPGVQWVMYFYQGYGLHGTYWHNNFGHPMSHGCVNLPNSEAEWLYNWAEVGTPVVVRW